MTRSRASYFVEAIPVFALYGLFRLLPVGAASALGGCLGRSLGRFFPSHKTADKNLAMALPERDASERRRIINRMWDNLGRTIAEYAHLEAFGGSPRVTVTGATHVKAVLASGKPAIFFAGHIANWEVPAMVVRANGIELPLIYRAPNNPYVDRLLHRARMPVTQILLPKGAKGSKDLIRLIAAGRSLGMLVDQKMNDGIAVPFFGRDAMTAPAMVKLATKYSLPLYPVEIERTSGANFRVTIHDALDIPAGEEALVTMTRINALLESWIRNRPDQWLWVHRRWPKDGD
jgi:KDO2-lipid IV(A) lauroyltransferase